MRNKKLAMLLLATVMVASTATATATLTSCGDKPPVTSSTPVDDVSISLNETATISEFDKLKLTATVVGEGDVVWTTSDPSIVTVEDGTIYGVKAGTATVTATIGEKSASCQVTVTATPYAHELVLSSQTVTLTEEGTNEVEVSVKFNGKPLTVDGVVYTWKPVDNAEEVATVTTTDNGAKATFTGLKVGEVTYEVSATVRGYEVTKLVTVNVVEAILALNMENEAFTSGENGLEVALTLGDAATESLTIGKVNLYRNGENKGETDVTWKMADGEFATVENGVITAKKAGTTTLTGTAQYNGRDVSITVSVKVVKGAVELQDTTVTVEAVAGKIAIPAAVQGTVQKITIGGVVVREAEQIGVQGGQADFLKENMPTDIREYGDNKKIIIETDKVVYTIPASVYTMIIDSKEDFDQWESVACDEAVRAGLCEEAYKGDYTTGYFVLGSDIEYNALYKPTVTFMTYGTHYNWKKDWGNDANFGFKGTIDGKGHTISGITVSGRYQGLVTTLSGGTIKNLAFVDATVGEGASLIAAAGSGTIENIYVQYKKITNRTGDRVGTIYANYTMPTRVTKNVVIDITDCEFDAEIKNTILFGYTYGTVENIVIIGEFDHKSADNMVGIAYNEGIVDLDASVLAHAPTYAALLEGDLTIVDALDQDFFAKNGSILLSKHEMEKHADETPALTNEETEIEVGTSLTLSGSKYVTYALKEEVAGVTLSGKIVNVAEDTDPAATITVVATSLVSGKSAEFTFTVKGKSYTLGTQIDADVLTYGAVEGFGLSGIWNKGVTDTPHVADLAGYSGKVAQFRNDESGMNAHMASITLNEPIYNKAGLNYIKLRMYASSSADTFSLRFYRSDRTSHQVEPDVWMDASANIDTNKWVDIYLDASKFMVDGKFSGLYFGVFTTGDSTLYLDYVSGEINAYALDDVLDFDKLSLTTIGNFGLSDMWNKSIQDASVIEGATVKVAKFSNNGGNMQYHGTSITLNTPVTVTEDMHYIKVRLYVQSTDLQTYALRFYRADRAAHGDGVDLDIGGLATNQWIDVYLDMARFVVNGKLESFRMASWAAGNADLYVDDITITDAKGTKVELTGAKIEAPHAGNQWGTDLTLSGASFTLTNGVSYSNAKLVFAEPVDVTGASYINICLRKSHELDVIFFNSDNAHKDTCLGATGFGAYTVVSLPVGNYAKDGKVSSISIGAWGDVTDFTLDVAYISVV